MKPETVFILALLAFLLFRRGKASEDTLNVKGRELLGPGLWRTEDWQTWERLSGPK